MKNGEPVWFDVAQCQLPSRELDLELVKADVQQKSQRWNDPRRLNAKMHGERLAADGRLDLNEPSRGGILDLLDLLPTSPALNVVARYERRAKCG